MTVQEQNPINQFIIAGGEISGPWSWFLGDENDLVVTKQLSGGGAVLPLVLGVDYSVNPAGIGSESGGTIDFLAPQLPAVVGDIWTLSRDTTADRSPDFPFKGNFTSTTVNDQLDKLTRLSQDRKRDILDAVRKDPGVGDSLNPLIPQPVDKRALKINDLGGNNFEIVMSDNDPDSQANEAAASAAAAAVSETNAAISETNAETAETNAETAETGAESAEAGAQTAQAAAEAAAASGLYKNVFDIDFSDSPYTILESQDGFLIQANTTGGIVVVNLPDSTGLSSDFRVGVAKMTADANDITIQRLGSDTINGGTSVSVVSQYQTLNLILDQSQGEYLATDISLANLSSPPPIGDVTPNTIKATSFEGPSGQAITQYDNDPTLAANSSTRAVTQSAVKGAIDAAGTVGVISAWPTSAVPAGYLECNGDPVSRTTFANLFSLIAETYGNGDGSTTFNLPDLRGQFIRGFDNGAGVDPDAGSRTDRGDGTTGDNVGTKQADAFGSHIHANGAAAGQTNFSSGSASTWFGAAQNTSATGGNETRPTNIYMMYIIKF